MSEAYERGIQKMWILNVGDIKPGEYQTELFLDMAWDIESVRRTGVKQHLQKFLTREFGGKLARQLLPLMDKHYELARIRRPEFMGGTRTEESNRQYWNTLRTVGWSDSECRQRIEDYKYISDAVEKISATINNSPLTNTQADHFFQLVKYPLQASAQMNFKFLCPFSESSAAYDSIASLTHIYNEGINNNGKWKGMMDMHPRRLPVFNRLGQPLATESKSTTAPLPPLHSFKVWGHDGELNGMGRYASMKDIPFTFKTGTTDSITVEVRLIPTHPVAGNKLRFRITIDGITYPSVEYQTHGRSEEWKQNILRGYAIRTLRLPVSCDLKTHRLLFSALDEGVLLSEIRYWR